MFANKCCVGNMSSSFAFSDIVFSTVKPPPLSGENYVRWLPARGRISALRAE